MKKLIIAIAALISTSAAMAQFKELVVEKVDNHGLVPGNTYRIYALLSDPEDQVHAVFATGGHLLKIQSAKPFYQHKYGGGTSSGINAELIKDNPELAYDSWVTIGMDQSVVGQEEPKITEADGKMLYYENSLNIMTLDTKEFEEGGTLFVEDGAWFCIPTMPQIRAGADRKVLLMQLTSEGEIQGLINIQGMDKNNQAFQEFDLTFTCN